MKDEMLQSQAALARAQPVPAQGAHGAQATQAIPGQVGATRMRPSQQRDRSPIRPMAVAVLYLLNFIFGFSALLGLGLAYIWLTDDRLEDWEKSHMAYLIRTFWVGFASIVAMVVLFVLTVVTAFTAMEDGAGEQPVGELGVALVASLGVFMLAMLWSLIRILRSMIRACSGKAMPKPGTWFI